MSRSNLIFKSNSYAVFALLFFFFGCSDGRQSEKNKGGLLSELVICRIKEVQNDGVVLAVVSHNVKGVMLNGMTIALDRERFILGREPTVHSFVCLALSIDRNMPISLVYTPIEYVIVLGGSVKSLNEISDFLNPK